MNETARCLGCNYLLRGLPENRCPECGREFDPGDPRTMNLGRVIGPEAQRWLKPPGWPLGITSLTAALALVCSDSAPAGYLVFFVVGIRVWMFVAAIWLVRLVVAAILARYYRQPAFSRVAIWCRWSTAPAIAGITCLLLMWHAPLYLTFYLSRPAMERFAQQVMRDPLNAPKETQIGLYPAERIEASSEDVQFLVRHSGSIHERGGFAYYPINPPAGRGYTHFWGAWYTLAWPWY